MSHRRRISRPRQGTAGPIAHRALTGTIAALAAATSFAFAAPAFAGPLQGTSTFGWADDAQVDHAGNVVGDINGDGRDDLAFGEGTTLLIVFGSSSGISRENIADGGAGVYRLGLPDRFENVDAAGDFDADGVDDLVVTAGKQAYVYYGARGPLEGSGALVGSGRVTTIPAGLDTGLAPSRLVASYGIGDFDGNGADDLVVARTDMRLAIVHGGARVDTIEATKKNARTSVINAPSECGWFYYIPVCAPRAEALVSAVGDFNGDGRDDLAVDSIAGSVKGKRWVVFGRTGTSTIEAASPSNAVQIPRPAATPDQIQASMPIRVGDLNGDGRDELHARDFAPPSNGYGTRYVLGSAKPTSPLDVATAPSIDLNAGWGARAVGDQDGDGRRDLVFLAPTGWMGAPATRKAGELRMITAPTGAEMVNGPSAPLVKGLPVAELLGSAVTDFDGDGSTDVALTATDALRNPGTGSAKQLYFVATKGADVAPPQLGAVTLSSSRFIGWASANLFVAAEETDTTLELTYSREVNGTFATVATERRPLQRGVNTLAITDMAGTTKMPGGSYRLEVRPIDPAGNRGKPKTVAYTLLDEVAPGTTIPLGVDSLRLGGDAATSDDKVIGLTNGIANSRGTAVFPVKRDYNGFTFEFEARVITPDLGVETGEGFTMAFITKDGDAAGNFLGAGGQQLGYGGLQGFALAFDTSKGPNDPSDNFVGWSPGTLGSGMQWVQTADPEFTMRYGSWMKVKVALVNRRAAVYVNDVLLMERAFLLPVKTRLAFTGATGAAGGQFHEIRNLKVS